MEKRFEIRPGSRAISNQEDAGLVGAELLKLERDGEVTPANIVAAAAKKRHPLHRFFTWDDTEAAGKYRLHEARMLINSVQVVIEVGDDKPPVHTKAFVRVEGAGSYRTIESVLNHEEMRTKHVADAYDALLSWKARYEHLVEFAEVFKAIPKRKPRKARRKKA